MKSKFPIGSLVDTPNGIGRNQGTIDCVNEGVHYLIIHKQSDMKSKDHGIKLSKNGSLFWNAWIYREDEISVYYEGKKKK